MALYRRISIAAMLNSSLKNRFI